MQEEEKLRLRDQIGFESNSQTEALADLARKSFLRLPGQMLGEVSRINDAVLETRRQETRRLAAKYGENDARVRAGAAAATLHEQLGEMITEARKQAERVTGATPPHGGRIKGRIIGVEGGPIAGAAVEIRAGSGKSDMVVARGTSDERGRYEIAFEEHALGADEPEEARPRYVVVALNEDGAEIARSEAVTLATPRVRTVDLTAVDGGRMRPASPAKKAEDDSAPRAKAAKPAAPPRKARSSAKPAGSARRKAPKPRKR